MNFVQTNIIGSKNVIDAAIDCKLKLALAISTDKVVDSSSLYGATKLCSEKLFIDAKVYSQKTKFSAIRFGNFENSSGSIFEYFADLKGKGAQSLPITDFRMRRYFISMESAVTRILEALTIMQGGEVFIPLMEERKIVDIANEIHPEARLIEIGIRPGEKLREKLYNEVEARNLKQIKNFNVVYST